MSFLQALSLGDLNRCPSVCDAESGLMFLHPPHFTRGPDPATIRADESQIERGRHGAAQHKVFMGEYGE